MYENNEYSWIKGWDINTDMMMISGIHGVFLISSHWYGVTEDSPQYRVLHLLPPIHPPAGNQHQDQNHQHLSGDEVQREKWQIGLYPLLFKLGNLPQSSAIMNEYSYMKKRNSCRGTTKKHLECGHPRSKVNIRKLNEPVDDHGSTSRCWRRAR